jgi:hypothetical protein
MIEFVMRLNEPLNVLIFLLLASFIAIWAYLKRSNKPAISLTPFIVLNFLLLLAWAGLYRVDHDETAHLHLSWLVSQGFIPYRDFWQHHPPFFWVVLAPLIKFLPPTSAIFDISRIASGVLFLVNACFGWQIAKKCWQEKANFKVYVLLLSSGSIYSQFLILRPDNLMIFFLLSGVYISFEVGGRRLAPSLLAGVSFGLATSFLPKQYLLLALPVIAVFTGEKKSRIIKLPLYFLGLIVGILPLFSYLFGNHIFKDFIFWVLNFNRRIIVASVYFPLVIGALGGWGACLLFKRWKEFSETKSLLVFFVFFLSTFSSITTLLALKILTAAII